MDHRTFFAGILGMITGLLLVMFISVTGDLSDIQDDLAALRAAATATSTPSPSPTLASEAPVAGTGTPTPTATPQAFRTPPSPAPASRSRRVYPTKDSSAYPTEAQWAKLRQCENGGRYTSKSGDRFRGAYQFDQRTWESVGGQGDPAQASPAEQDSRAKRLYRLRGAQPWPVCGKYLR